MHKLKFLGSIAALAVLAGCQTIPLADNAAKINAGITWSAKSGCSKVSPVISLAGVPAGTRHIQVKMRDLDYAAFNHGGGEVAYNGEATIAEGALKTYNGPCPPGGSHRYEFTVNALNADKSMILGQGVVVKRYPE